MVCCRWWCGDDRIAGIGVVPPEAVQCSDVVDEAGQCPYTSQLSILNSVRKTGSFTCMETRILEIFGK